MAEKQTRLVVDEHAEIWRRWKDGQGLGDIARALGRGIPAVHHVIAQRGGVAPRERKRSPRSPIVRRA